MFVVFAEQEALQNGGMASNQHNLKARERSGNALQQASLLLISSDRLALQAKQNAGMCIEYGVELASPREEVVGRSDFLACRVREIFSTTPLSTIHEFIDIAFIPARVTRKSGFSQARMANVQGQASQLRATGSDASVRLPAMSVTLVYRWFFRSSSSASEKDPFARRLVLSAVDAGTAAALE